MIPRTPVAGTAVHEPAPEWQGRPSLSESAAHARDDLQPDREGNLIPTYARLYRQYIGRQLYTSASSRLNILRAMHGVSQFCRDNELDFILYVSAQMASLRDYVAKTKHGFQPNMLLGARALGRYNAHVRKLGRSHRAEASAVAWQDRSLLLELYASEFSAGAHLAAAYVDGRPIALAAAVKQAEVGMDWWGVVAGPKAPTPETRKIGVTLRQRLGDHWVNKLLRCARLEAACAVADRYRPALSDWIGVREPFSWTALGVLLGELFAPAPARAVPERLAACAWHPRGVV